MCFDFSIRFLFILDGVISREAAKIKQENRKRKHDIQAGKQAAHKQTRHDVEKETSDTRMTFPSEKHESRTGRT